MWFERGIAFRPGGQNIMDAEIGETNKDARKETEKDCHNACPTRVYIDPKICLSMVVRFNVGGQLFITSEDTVHGQESMLSVMLKHPNPAQIIDGAFFIDRDPAMFRWILNFMRGSVILPAKDSQELMQLKEEAEYFALDSLIAKIQHVMCPSFAVNDNVTVRQTKFTVVAVDDEGYKMTRGGKAYKINACETVESTSVEVGDVIMAYHVPSRKRKPGICMAVEGKHCTVQFNGDLGQEECIYKSVRF